MTKTPYRLFFLGALLSLTTDACLKKARSVQAQDRLDNAPRLTVVLVVDQMRGDDIERYKSLWQYGLKRLLDGGTHYTQAFWDHGVTSCQAGYATLATGVMPQIHGIAGASFFDARQKNRVRLCSDEAATCASMPLAVATLADRLKKQSPESRVVAMGQSNTAVHLLGGSQPDLLAWLPEHRMVLAAQQGTRTVIPDWLANYFQQAAAPEQLLRTWQLPPLPENLVQRLLVSDAPKYDCGHGLSFPHQISENLDPTLWADAWRCTPDVDRLVAQMALHAAQHMALGTDDTPDILYVSFHAIEVIGSHFGLESLERAAAFAALDQAIGALLDGLVESVGPRIRVVLTSDHGAPLQAQLYPDALMRTRHVDLATLERNLQHTLSAKFPGQQHLDALDFPFIRVHADDAPTRLAKASLVAATLRQYAPVFRAWTQHELATDADPVAHALRLASHPDRSGDVVWTLLPGILPSTLASPSALDRHGSPWPYDRHVPMLIWGEDRVAGRIDQAIGVIDVMQKIARDFGMPELTSSASKALPAMQYALSDDSAAFVR